MEDIDTRNRIISGNALFLKFWYYDHNPVYTISNIPGKNKNVTGSIAGGINIGVNNYSDEIHKKAAIKALEFITSKDIQKKYIVTKDIYSPIISLYDDEEVCSYIDCDIIKNALPLSVLDFNINIDNIAIYVNKYKKFVYDYLYRNYTISEVVKKIDDLTKNYYFSIEINDTVMGLIFFILISIIIFIMVVSLLFLFCNKFKKQFEMLTKDLWILSLLGSIFIMCSIYTIYGVVTPFRCKLTMPLIYFGHLMNLIPIVYSLIVNFPEENKISNWFSNNKSIFLLIIISTDFVVNFTMLFSPYEIENIVTENGEHFNKCKDYKSFGKILNLLSLTSLLLIIICISFLLFLEWNIKVLYNERRFITGLISMNILSILLFVITYAANIKEYIIFNLLFALNVSFFAVSNYLFVYGIRILYMLVKQEKKDFDEEEYLKKNQEFNENIIASSIKGSNQSFPSRKTSEIKNTLINYHYKVSKDSTIDEKIELDF